jgi:hypothetical protein
MFHTFFFLARQPLVGPGNPHYRGFTITLRHITLRRTHLGRVTIPKHIILPENTQHCLHTDTYALGGIQKSNPSNKQSQTDVLDRVSTENQQRYPKLCVEYYLEASVDKNK